MRSRSVAVVFRPAVILADAEMILGKERRVERKLAPIGQGIAALDGLRRDLRVIFLQDKVVLIGDLETMRQSQLKFLREKVLCLAVPGDGSRIIEIDIEFKGRQHIDIGTRRESAASRPTGLVIRADQFLARADPLHRHFRQHEPSAAPRPAPEAHHNIRSPRAASGQESGTATRQRKFFSYS